MNKAAGIPHPCLNIDLADYFDCSESNSIQRNPLINEIKVQKMFSPEIFSNDSA